MTGEAETAWVEDCTSSGVKLVWVYCSYCTGSSFHSEVAGLVEYMPACHTSRSQNAAEHSDYFVGSLVETESACMLEDCWNADIAD